MEVEPQQLVVRQHERRACKIAATVRVGEQHAAVVELARTVGDGTGAIGVTVVDASHGGVGLESPVFLPRGAAVTVSIRNGAVGTPIEVPSRVQRVTMISREPRYYLGLAYVGGQEHRAQTIGQVLELARSEAAEGGAR